MLPPIAVFAYNRAQHLKTCLEAIERSQAFFQKRLPLYIFCDAARKPEDVENVEKTRAVAENHEGAFVFLREKNMGFRNITTGISQICEKYGKVIVIEDDVIIAPDFLPFMIDALEKYENERQVFMISGFMYFDSQPKKPSTFFLPSTFIWGWATWKRAWDHFSWEPEGWQAFLKNKKERYFYDYFGSVPFSKMLEKTLQGKWNTWDAQWMFTVFREKGLSLYPNLSLVWNCGVGGGTHGSQKLDHDPLACHREVYIHGDLQIEDFRKPRLGSYCFPKKIEINKKAMHRLAVCFLKEKWRKKRKLSILPKLIQQKITSYLH